MKKSELRTIINEVVDECGIETQLKNRLNENASHRDELLKIENELKSNPNDLQLKALYNARKFIRDYVKQSAKTG